MEYSHEYFKKYRFPLLSQLKEVPLQLSERLAEELHCGKPIGPDPYIVPPTWNKTDGHDAISAVWKRAAKELSEAEYIFIAGYSMPVTDAFFRLLFCLGTIGPGLIKKLIVFNPDTIRGTEARYRSLVGPGAAAAFEYSPNEFEGALSRIKNMFPSPPK